MYKWSDELTTGVAKIDEQHKELIDRVNRILEACSQQRGRAEIASYLQFLENYIAEHFQAEEEQMRAHAYAGLKAHSDEHFQFTRQIAAVKREFNEHGSAIHVLLQAVRLSGDWLVSHIKKTDKTMAAFLRTKEGAGTA